MGLLAVAGRLGEGRWELGLGLFAVKSRLGLELYVFFRMGKVCGTVSAPYSWALLMTDEVRTWSGC